MRRMRIVILISVILTINCMLVVSAEDRPMIVLDNETYADVFGNVSHVSELYYENGAIKVTFTPGGNDPYIYLPLSLMGDIPCNEYKVLAIKMKAPQPGSGNLYFATDRHNSLDENKNVRTSEYRVDGKWQIVTVDFSTNEYYEGVVTQFRFDVYPKSVDGVLEIEWIAMFRSLEEVKEVEGGDVEEPEETPKYAGPTRTPDYVPPKTKTDARTSVLMVLFGVLFACIVAALIISILYLRKVKEAQY